MPNLLNSHLNPDSKRLLNFQMAIGEIAKWKMKSPLLRAFAPAFALCNVLAKALVIRFEQIFPIQVRIDGDKVAYVVVGNPATAFHLRERRRIDAGQVHNGLTTAKGGDDRLYLHGGCGGGHGRSSNVTRFSSERKVLAIPFSIAFNGYSTPVNFHHESFGPSLIPARNVQGATPLMV